MAVFVAKGSWLGSWSKPQNVKCQSLSPGSNHSSDEQPQWRSVCTPLQLAACVQLIVALDAAPVYAIERAMKPRRHNRRLGETDTFRPIWESYRKSVKKRKVRADVLEKARKSGPQLKEIRLSAKGSPNYSVPWPDGSQIAGRFQGLSRFAFSTLFLFAFLYAVGFLIKIAKTWMQSITRGTRSPRQSRKGRVVSDRSLGGKEVFVPSETVDWNPLGAEKVTFRLQGRSEQKATMLPPWWKPRLYIYVDEVRKREAKSKAQGLVNRLDDLRVSGRDYSFELIVELYKICNDACISARTSSKNIATSIFRYAVIRTVMLVEEGIGLSYGLEEIPFLCALSEILELPTQTAVTTMYTETAIALRAKMLQVFVDVRSHAQQEKKRVDVQHRSQEAMSGLAVKSLIRLLKMLPIPAAEAELIGSSITSSTTEKERIQVYDTLTAAGPEFADVIGKLLGKLDLTSMDD